MREREIVERRFEAMLFHAGRILQWSGVVALMPLAALPFMTCGGLAAVMLLACGLLQTFVGWLLRRRFRRGATVSLTVRDGGIVVTVGWTAAIALSALPFMPLCGLTPVQALFESTSAWTTTGLTVVDVENADPLVLLHRSLMQFAGGAGFAILMMSVLTAPAGVGVASAEGRADQLVPQVRRSARIVLALYSGYALAGIAAFRLAGMDPFDAVNHALAAVSTGGFSTRADSLAHWDSALVEAAALPLMILGSLSFVTAWLLARGGFRATGRSGELRLAAVLLPAAAGAIFLLTARGLYPSLGKQLRVALFETVSALTTTGFQSVGYGDWNAAGVWTIIALMLIGGGVCSTSGGIKQGRVHLMWCALMWEIQAALAPRDAIQRRVVWEGERMVTVGDERIRRTGVYLFLYLSTWIVGAGALCACGYPLADSLFEFASALGTVGLSVGVTGADTPISALLVMIQAMLLGRLEFMVVIVSMVQLARDGRTIHPRFRAVPKTRDTVSAIQVG